MTRKQFEALVAEAIQTIPRRFRAEMQNVAVVVEDEPPDALLDEMEIPPDDTLFGLYQGHYFGLSEEEIEAIEERYWRGDAEDA